MRRIVAALVGGAVFVAMASANPAFAQTELSPATEFPVVAVFSEPWVIELQLTATNDDFAPIVDESSGSVDVFIDQVPGTFLSDLTVQPDGRVFITQPPSLPWLAPGNYDVRAVFTAAAANGLQSTQVLLPGALTIEPIELAASASIATDPATATTPIVTLELEGVGDEQRLSLPPGVWVLEVREAGSDELLVSREVAQSVEPGPLDVDLGDSLRAGRDHVLSVEFTPVTEYAPGVTVTGTGEQAFQTANRGFAELLVGPVTVPVWAAVAIGVGVLLGIVGLVVPLIQAVGRRGSIETPAAEERPGDAESP